MRTHMLSSSPMLCALALTNTHALAITEMRTLTLTNMRAPTPTNMRAFTLTPNDKDNAAHAQKE